MRIIKDFNILIYRNIIWLSSLVQSTVASFQIFLSFEPNSNSVKLQLSDCKALSIEIKIFSVHVFDLIIVCIRKFCNALENNIDELKVERLRQIGVKGVFLDPVWWFFKNDSEPLEEVRLDQISMIGVNKRSYES